MAFVVCVLEGVAALKCSDCMKKNSIKESDVFDPVYAITNHKLVHSCEQTTKLTNCLDSLLSCLEEDRNRTAAADFFNNICLRGYDGGAMKILSDIDGNFILAKTTLCNGFPVADVQKARCIYFYAIPQQTNQLHDKEMKFVTETIYNYIVSNIKEFASFLN